MSPVGPGAWPTTLEDLEAALGAVPHRRDVAEPGWKRAAVALVVRPAAGGAHLETLLIQRAEHPLDPWSGHMAFPGGRSDPRDTDLEATAIRETLEEVGLDLRQARRLGRMDEVQAGGVRPRTLAVMPWVFGWEGDAPLTLSPEADDALWVPLPHLTAGDRRTTLEWLREGVNYRFPAISLGERRVWGLTLRMIEDLFQVVAGGA